MAKGQGKAGKIIAYILILLVVVGAIGFLAYFTGGFTTGFKTFSVEVNGKNITTSASGYEMTVNDPLTVNVKYTFAGDEVSGYSVKVVPNALAGKDFDFKLDDDVYSYQAEKDLTDGFDIEYNEHSFTIKPKGGITEILQAIYPNNVVEDCRNNAYENMYTLVVTSYNGEASIMINFSVFEKLTGIELDKTHIIF